LKNLRNEDGTEEVEVEIDQSEIDSLNRMVEDEDIEEVEVNPSMITLDVTYRSKLDSSLVTPKKFCKLHQDGDWIYGLVML
jgi:copper chaperone CopZ